MKTLRMLLAVIAVGLLGLGVSGCKEKVATPTKTGTKVETPKTPETPAIPAKPAEKKPKDHPAH